MTREVFYNEVDMNPGFNVCREAIDYLVEHIRDIEVRMEGFKKLGMPVQYIHADLHYDNVMVVGDKVSGLLDFEFCTYDWRAMELAVALSKYVGEAEPLPLIERFVTGYVQKGALTDTEIDCIPDMINLRIFSNVVYFTGRAIAGEDGLDSLTSRAGTYAKRVKWVNANKDAIKNTIKQKLLVLTTVS
jgi:homoserine kinase type II